jgi:hypothetical protein
VAVKSTELLALLVLLLLLLLLMLLLLQVWHSHLQHL